MLRAALAAMDEGIEAAMVTVIGVGGSAPRDLTARMLVYRGGEIVGTVGGGQWERRLIQQALEVLDTGRPRRYAAHLTRDLGMCCGGAMEAFIEPLLARERLHIFGAGHVGGEVARLALSLDFDVLVYDDREDWLTPERFPGCTAVAGDPLRSLPEQLGPSDYLLILTHSHQLDQALLQRLIDRDYAYLGMIGSRSKVAKFFVRLRAAEVDEALFSRVCAPVGLAIGAETPAEIAVSICAELIKVRRGRRGPARAMSEDPLPARGGEGIAVAPRLLDER